MLGYSPAIKWEKKHPVQGEYRSPVMGKCGLRRCLTVASKKVYHRLLFPSYSYFPKRFYNHIKIPDDRQNTYVQALQITEVILQGLVNRHDTVKVSLEDQTLLCFLHTYPQTRTYGYTTSLYTIFLVYKAYDLGMLS